jgi:hypothetical protein
MAAYDAAVEVSSSLRDSTPKHKAAAAITDRANDELERAGANLADLEPTTTAGLLALLAHVLACIPEGDCDGDGPGNEPFDGGNWRLPHMVALDDGNDEHFIVLLLRSIERTVCALADLPAPVADEA